MATDSGRGRRAGGLAGALTDVVLRGVDVNALLEEVDVDHVLAQVDVNALLDRVDVNRVLDRVDVDRLLDRVDVDRLVDRADPDRILDRVDPDRLLDRVDVERLVARAQIAEIVAASTGQVAGTALDSVRRQVVALDVVVMRLLYGLTGRDLGKLPAGPTGLVQGPGDAAVPDLDRGGSPVEMNGRYAGLLSRALSVVIDLALATSVFSATTALLSWVLAGVLGLDLPRGFTSGALFFGGLLSWWTLYWVATTSLQGRTPGMGLVGLRVVTRDARPLPTRRVVVWVLGIPPSLFFGIGYALALVSTERQTLHDRLAGAVVVYDWGRDRAHVPTPLEEFLRVQAGPSGG